MYDENEDITLEQFMDSYFLKNGLSAVIEAPVDITGGTSIEGDPVQQTIQSQTPSGPMPGGDDLDPNEPTDQGMDDGMGGMDDFGGGMDGGMDDGGFGGDMGNEPPPETSEEIEDKIKVRKLATKLHGIISDNLTSLNDIQSYDNPDVIATVDRVKKHLDRAKEVLFDIITVDIDKCDIEDIQFKYTTCAKMYDVCLNMLDVVTKEPDK